MDWSRYFVVLITQAVAALFFIIIIYKLLKRRKDQSSILLSCFYLSLTLAFIMNILTVTLIFSNSNLADLIKTFYILLSFLILFGFAFLVVFILDLYYVQSLIKSMKGQVFILMYGIFSFCVFYIPGALSFIGDEFTIQYSFELSIVLYIFCTFSSILPSIIFIQKILKSIKHPSLRKKYKRFIWGLFGVYLDLYGAILYNTWHNPIYRSIWGILTTFILLSSAYLIYIGIGRDISPSDKL